MTIVMGEVCSQVCLSSTGGSETLCLVLEDINFLIDIAKFLLYQQHANLASNTHRKIMIFEQKATVYYYIIIF